MIKAREETTGIYPDRTDCRMTWCEASSITNIARSNPSNFRPQNQSYSTKQNGWCCPAHGCSSIHDRLRSGDSRALLLRIAVSLRRMPALTDQRPRGSGQSHRSVLQSKKAKTREDEYVLVIKLKTTAFVKKLQPFYHFPSRTRTIFFSGFHMGR